MAYERIIALWSAQSPHAKQQLLNISNKGAPSDSCEEGGAAGDESAIGAALPTEALAGVQGEELKFSGMSSDTSDNQQKSFAPQLLNLGEATDGENGHNHRKPEKRAMSMIEQSYESIQIMNQD
jgi:hypothetical protein